MEAWTPPHDGRTRRHVLTHRGLRLLALRAGVAPEAYRRIYGVLDDMEQKTRRGLVFARANLAHTDGINRVYLALLGAAHIAGGTLQWRGEWACTHTYADGPRLHTLRPDAEGWYSGPEGAVPFFVEVDRGTTRLWRLATKFVQYYAPARPTRDHPSRSRAAWLASLCQQQCVQRMWPAPSGHQQEHRNARRGEPRQCNRQLREPLTTTRPA